MTRKDSIDPELGSVEESLTYHYRNHAVVAVDGTASGPGRYEMEYDAAGNMTVHRDNKAKRVKEMAYDSTNRVRTITNPSTGEVMGKYWYDDGGFRVRRISRRETDGVTYEHEVLYPTMYMGLEIQKGSEGNMIENSYASVNNIYLNGLRVAAMTPSGETVYYLTDNVDSVRVVADERGKPVTRTEYLPYGETWFQIGNTNHAPKYNSQELDKESGLYYYNARYYDPEVGRFVTADSVIDGEYETQGWNRYSYVKGNPVRYGDPSGNASIYGSPNDWNNTSSQQGSSWRSISEDSGNSIASKLQSDTAANRYNGGKVESKLEVISTIRGNYDGKRGTGFTGSVDYKLTMPDGSVITHQAGDVYWASKKGDMPTYPTEKGKFNILTNNTSEEIVKFAGKDMKSKDAYPFVVEGREKQVAIHDYRWSTGCHTLGDPNTSKNFKDKLTEAINNPNFKGETHEVRDIREDILKKQRPTPDYPNIDLNK